MYTTLPNKNLSTDTADLQKSIKNYDSFNLACNDSMTFFEKVQVGKDQEKAQLEKKFPLQKPRWEKTKLTIKYLCNENIS